MEIRKEKNLVRFVVNDVERTININTGKMYGKHGDIVRTLGFAYCNMTGRFLYSQECAAIPALQAMLNYCSSSTHFLSLISSGFWNFADRVAHLPHVVTISNQTICDWERGNKEQLEKLLKNQDFLVWAHENEKVLTLSAYEVFSGEQFLRTIKQKINASDEECESMRLLKTKLPNNLPHLINAMLWFVKYYLRNPAIKTYAFRSNTTYDETDSIANYDDKASGLARVARYITLSFKLKRELSTTDFYRDSAIVEDLYYNKLLSELNAKFLRRYSNVFLFQNDLCQIVLPTSGTDLIQEGKALHHCVGSYVNKVVNGDCAIVFVRKRDNPTVPYITCEILPNGSIRQYYKKSDYYISTPEEHEFYDAYQQYLRAHREEIEKLLTTP